MKNTLLFVLFIFCYLPNFSQIFFGKQQLISSFGISRPETVFTADLDGNGYQDIILSSYGDESVSWLKNQGNSGTFTNPMILDEDTPQPAGAIAEDIDGDGDKDIIYASWEKDVIFWVSNLDGQGNFSSPHTIDGYASGVWKLYTSDIDGDGDADLIVPLREGGAIVWYENLDGQGNFSEKKTIDPAMQNAREAFPADINGDGFIDVVSLDWFTGSVMWYRNLDGKANFSERIIINNQLQNPFKLICSDLDGNGAVDILVVDDSGIFWFKNSGNQGLFSAPTPIAAGDQVYNFDITDFDHDQDIDILVTYSYYGKLGWYRNNGLGSFSNLLEIANPMEGFNIITGADFDQDGDVDLLGSNASFSTIVIHWNLDGMGTTSDPQIITASDLNGPTDLFITDSNDDGQKDIFTAAKIDDAVYVFEKNNRNNAYASVKKIAEINSPSSIFMKDLDGDDKVDLLACSEESGSLNWYKNNGQNNFGPASPIATFGAGASCIYSTDLDNDGDNDVLAANLWSNKVSWFENTGNGAFGTEKLIGEGLSGATDIHSGDIDGDGDEDILVASKYSRVSYFLNNGNKSFAPESVIETGMNSVEKIWAIDMDSDGDLDVLTHGYDEIVWYENEMRFGSINTKHVVNENEYLYNIGFVLPMDADADGDLDVCASWGQKGNIAWFEQNSETKQFSKQDFAPHNINGPTVLAADDINGDGRTDLISASFSDNKIAWYKSELFPEFTSQPRDTQICNNGQLIFHVGMQEAETFKWQMKLGYSSIFYDIEDGDQFSGSNTSTLVINVSDPSFDMSKVRCKIKYMGVEFISNEALMIVDRLIVAYAGQDKETCYKNIYLQGEWPQFGTGLWSISVGSGNFSDPGNPYTYVDQLIPGENTFLWTVTNGICESSDQVTIIVKDSVQIQNHTSSVEIASGSMADLIVEATGDGLNYQWYKDGNALSDNTRILGSRSDHLTISDVNASDQGFYHCLIYGDCNQVFTGQIPLNVISSTDDGQPNSVKIYPNPVAKVLYFSSDQPISKVWIYRPTGIEVLSAQNEPIGSLDISDLPKGVYLIRILIRDQFKHFRVIKI